MAVTIYNHALTGFYPVELTAYGFNISPTTGQYVKLTAVGESIEVLAAGDTVNLTTSVLIAGTLTVNGQVYTRDDSPVTLNGVVLTEPVKFSATEGGRGRFVIDTFDKYDTPAVTDEQFADMHLYFPFSPTGETLEAATAEFTVYTSNSSAWKKGTVVDIHDSDGILGRFYIDTCIKTYAGQYAITASDVINQLANDTFYGYIGYQNDMSYGTSSYTKPKLTNDFYTVTQVCADIFGDWAHTVSDAYKTLEVPGYIPYGTAKDALQYLCLGCGLYVRTYRTETPVIQSADTYATHTIPDTKVTDSVSISPVENTKTAVKIRMLQYIVRVQTFVQNTFRGFLLSGKHLFTPGTPDDDTDGEYSDGNNQISYMLTAREDATVTAPYWVRAFDTFTGAAAIVDMGDISSEADTDFALMIIKGRPVLTNEERYGRKTEYKIFGSGEALELADNATTVTVVNAEAVANRMIAYHGKSREANITYIMSANEMPGDRLILPLDKTYGNISGRILSLDITPGVTKTFADAVIICDEEDEDA